MFSTEDPPSTDEGVQWAQLTVDGNSTAADDASSLCQMSPWKWPILGIEINSLAPLSLWRLVEHHNWQPTGTKGQEMSLGASSGCWWRKQSSLSWEKLRRWFHWYPYSSPPSPSPLSIPDFLHLEKVSRGWCVVLVPLLLYWPFAVVAVETNFKSFAYIACTFTRTGVRHSFMIKQIRVFLSRGFSAVAKTLPLRVLNRNMALDAEETVWNLMKFGQRRSWCAAFKEEFLCWLKFKNINGRGFL